MAEKRANWGKLGGSHKMHGKTGTGTQKPGGSSQEGSGSLTRNQKVQAGPSNAGFYSKETSNKDYAGTQTPGVSAATKSGGNSKFAEGGKHSMFGPGNARAAQGGRTSSN